MYTSSYFDIMIENKTVTKHIIGLFLSVKILNTSAPFSFQVNISVLFLEVPLQTLKAMPPLLHLMEYRISFLLPSNQA